MYEFLHYQTLDVMTPDPVVIASDATLAEAERIFDEHSFNALPVVDAQRRLVGLVTKLDLLRAFRFTEAHMFPPYEEIMRAPVSEVMTESVETVRPRTPLTRVLQKLLDTGNKSFAVVDRGELVGMIAREDVMRALHRASKGEKAPSR